MCGFVGVVTREPIAQVLDPRSWDPAVLRHRGPDAEGALAFTHAHIRHWRLSIVDVSSRSDQPFGRDDAWLVYNGEIYNHQALARAGGIAATGDTSYLFEVCRQGRRSDLRHARGFYSFLYVEGDGRRVSGARDPFGKKPLFYLMDEAAGIAAFASEEQAILDALGPRQVDGEALSEYLLYKQLFHGRTWFTGIRQMAPGATFTLDVARWQLRIDRTWQAYYQQPAATVFDLAPSAGVPTEGDVENVLRESVDLRLPREVPASFALSGGVDSTLLLRLAVETRQHDRISRILTVAFPGSPWDESAHAARVAAQLGLGDRHVVVPFTNDDLLPRLTACIRRAAGPLEHPHHLSYSVLCEAAARYGKVLLTGEGADELFLGYQHYAQSIGSFAFREYLTAEDEAVLERPDGRVPFGPIRQTCAVEPWRAAATTSRGASREGELKSHLLTLLARNDRMGMAHSVEVRAPFLDRTVLATALSLPEAALVEAGVTKVVLRRLAERGRQPLGLDRPKVGFRVPFDEWFVAEREMASVRALCERASEALEALAGLRLKPGAVVPPRLGWSLVNLGVFLTDQEIGR